MSDEILNEMPLLTRDDFSDLEAISKRMRNYNSKHGNVALHYLAQRAVDELRAAREEIELLKKIVEADRSKIADGVSKLKRELDSRHWLTEGRGCYEWNDDRFHNEDFGPCVLMRIDDPGYLEIGSNLDEDFNEPGFTHFAEVPKLTHEEADELRAALAESEAANVKEPNV